MKTKNEFRVGKHNIGYVSSSILEKLPETFISSERTLTSNTLKRYMTDIEITKEFNVKDCEVGDVVHFLDTATEEQKDRNWNLFYFSDFVVGAGWFGGGWNVRTWRRGHDGWDGDARVFSPATALSNSCTHCTLETRILELEIFKKNVEKVLKLS